MSSIITPASSQFPSLVESMKRLNLSLSAGSSEARSHMTVFAINVIEQYDFTWLNFLVNGVQYHWEWHLNSDKKHEQWVIQINDLMERARSESYDDLGSVRSMLKASLKRFGDHLLAFWCEGLARAMEESVLHDWKGMP